MRLVATDIPKTPSRGHDACRLFAALTGKASGIRDQASGGSKILSALASVCSVCSVVESSGQASAISHQPSGEAKPTLLDDLAGATWRVLACAVVPLMIVIAMAGDTRLGEPGHRGTRHGVPVYRETQHPNQNEYHAPEGIGALTLSHGGDHDPAQQAP